VYLWLQTLLFVFILWDLYRTKAALLAGLQAYVFGAYTAVFGAVLNYAQTNAFYTHQDRYSLGDTNPDGYGFILALGIPVACYLAASAEVPKVFRFINYAYLPVAFVGIALSGTRTASVGAAIGLLYGLATLTKLKIHTRIAVVPRPGRWNAPSHGIVKTRISESPKTILRTATPPPARRDTARRRTLARRVANWPEQAEAPRRRAPTRSPARAHPRRPPSRAIRGRHRRGSPAGR